MKKSTLFFVTALATSAIFFTMRSNTRADRVETAVTPFRLLNFDVRLKEKARVLSWSVEGESQLDHFEVWRSTSAHGNFEVVYSLYPTKGSAGTYYYTDEASIPGNMVYYELAQVGKDGYARLSSVIYAKTDIIDRITLYPNPATDNVSVSFGNIVQRANIKIVNQQGSTVMAISNFSGNNMTQDISRLAGGMYFVQATTEDGVATASFIKKTR